VLDVIAVPGAAEERLGAGGGEGVGVADAGPGIFGHRRAPAQGADGRLGVGNVEELRAAVRACNAADEARCGADDEGVDI
jgi:hypothetical protein